MRQLIAIPVLAISLAFAVASGAATIRGSATLDGNQEVPPVLTDASGSMSFELDDVTGLLDLSGSVDGIFLADITFPEGGLAFGAAGPFHIHTGAAGENGPVVIPFNMASFFSDTATGLAVSATGVPVDPSLFGPILGGNTYFNLHSLEFPSGQVRGQISAAIPEPTGGLLFAMAFGLAAVRTRRRTA